MHASNRFFRYTPAAHFLVTDEDAGDFLQSQFSNELRPFEPGQCTYGLWLDVKGKVIADSVVLCEGEEQFRVLSERCAGQTIAAHMERHIIADDVVIEHRATAGFGIELSALGVDTLEFERPKRGCFVSLETGVLFCVSEDRYHLVLDCELEAQALVEQLVAEGFSAYSEAERGLARMAAGMPQVPDEIGAADLPGEGGVEVEAVSFTKGCYLGQEVVARMHNLGKPQRGLFVVTGQGDFPELPSALYNSDLKQVGELRTAYTEAEHWRGVAMLKVRFVIVGEVLTYGSNSEVVVRSLLREGLEHG